ncbi:MAG: SDR family NAD(P)-dependent oxidoreductase [Micromonosporaceae bacterium]
MKTVLITGASSGIGLAAAIAAAEAGFTTVATVRRPDGELAVREAAEKAGVCVDVVRLELTDPESVHDCIESVISRHGRLDALVNNAGIAGINHTLELSSMAVLRASMEVNFFGVVAMSQAAMAHLRATRGRLITISSVREAIFRQYREWVGTGAVEGAQLVRSVAEVVVYALTADRPPLRIQTSEYARRYVSRKLADPDGHLVQELTRAWLRGH